MSENDTSIRWSAVNPYNHLVVLKQDTYEYHVIDDHAEKDAEQRAAIEKHTRCLIEQPRYIYQDNVRDTRYKYFDTILIKTDTGVKMKGLMAVIETDCNPHEVVTWMPQSKLKEEIPEGKVVYDAHAGILGNS